MSELIKESHIFYISFFLMMISMKGFSFELELGGVNQKAQPNSVDGYREYYLSHSFPGESTAYVKNERGENSYYSLDGASVLYDVNMIPKTERSFIFNSDVNELWRLGRWPKELDNMEIKDLYRPSPDWIDSDGWAPYVDESYALNNEDGRNDLGCIHDMPLRYGDVEGDAQNELVLFLGAFEYKHDLVVFSPNHERITFSMRYALQDFIRFPESKWQYIQRTRQVDNNVGVRTYAKAYIVDFDQDSHPDILVWRKRFESRNESDPIEGFELKEQVWQHFERDLIAQEESEQGVTGEYFYQNTESETIQSWLLESELTWSKGYPSTSECEGQEGDLILEMHDPLLNDPDVLQ